MLGKELSYGWRRLQQRPGFTLTALLILGLGIGANTAIFSLLDEVALRPLPYRDPDQMVKIWALAPDLGIDQVEVSHTKFQALRDRSQKIAAVTVYYRDTFNLTEAGSPESLPGARISKEFFDVWGIDPVVGRRFSATEDAKGGADVLLISQGYWKRRFASDPHVVGKILHFEGRPFEVIGVMPDVLRFPFKNEEVWLPRAQEFALLPEAMIDKGASLSGGGGAAQAGRHRRPGARRDDPDQPDLQQDLPGLYGRTLQPQDEAAQRRAGRGRAQEPSPASSARSASCW